MNTRGLGRAGGRGGEGAGTAAAVLGGIALLTSVVAVGGLLGLLGVIVSLVAFRAAGRDGSSRNHAVIGLVTSSIAVVVSVAVVICVVWFAHKTQSCYPYNKVHPWMQCVQRQFGGR